MPHSNGNGGIVNPFSKVIVKLEVNDQLQTTLHAPNIHPKELAKILSNVMIDVLFGYVGAVADAVERQAMVDEINKPR